MGFWDWLGETAKKSGPKLLNGESYQEHIEHWTYGPNKKVYWHGMFKYDVDVLTEDFLVRYLPEITRYSSMTTIVNRYKLSDRFIKLAIRGDSGNNIKPVLYSPDTISKAMISLAIDELKRHNTLTVYSSLDTLVAFGYQKNSSCEAKRIINLFLLNIVMSASSHTPISHFLHEFPAYIRMQKEDLELFWGGLENE